MCNVWPNDGFVNKQITMTTHQARGYQEDCIRETQELWDSGVKNVAVVLPTGAGKTFVLARLIELLGVPAVAIAHRSELVGQMSVALGREGIRHRVIGPPELARTCASLHMSEFRRSFIDPNGLTAVASVDTLVRMDPNVSFFSRVGLWVQDECHHVLRENKWGAATQMFPNARGLGVTATPVRADGRGLGRHADGLFDALVVGPTMRELIRSGYLTEYRIFAPPNDLDLSSVTTTDSGDYSPPKLKAARRRSQVTGNVVQHYLRIAPGRMGVTFDTDIESATETAQAYRDAGVPAQVVSSKTPDALRAAILRSFRSRDILQLVNVDLFGEGFDLPAIEVVSMARPTQSYGLFCQQFGRALRPLEGKPHAIIIDHVGNVARHGLPDARREWSLDRRERRARGSANDAVLIRTCLNPECVSVYERALRACPYCGYEVLVTGRSSPAQVDGDLTELDPSVLARLRGEIEHVDLPARIPRGLPIEAMRAVIRRHEERQSAQAPLRGAIALWSGWQREMGREDPEIYRRFYLAFGLDVASAQALGTREATELCAVVTREIQRNNIQERIAS